MTQTEDFPFFEKRVRLQVYTQFVTTGQAPTSQEVASALSCSLSELQAAYRRLAAGKALVLQKSGEVLMAEPFSAVPTPFTVEVGTQWWWGNCIWDALGVLPWDMVDKSTGPFQAHLGPVFGDETVQRGLLFPEPGCIGVLLRAPSPNTPRPDPPPFLALAPLKRRSATMDMRAPRAPSIVGRFFRLPSPAYAVGSVAPDVCHLVLEAAGALPAVSGEDAQNDSSLATTRDGRAGVGTAVL